MNSNLQAPKWLLSTAVIKFVAILCVKSGFIANSDACTEAEFLCDNGSKCLPSTWRCDGQEDCIDGSDEKLCVPQSCSIEEFLCISGECVAARWRCDGSGDCKDNSDEYHCDALAKECTVDNNKFLCKDGRQCIDLTKACNLNLDCHDGSDESVNCSNSCNSTNCQQLCQETSDGSICSCLSGYKLQTNGKTCEDIDECQEQICSHYCLNNLGSFHCSCAEGYELQSSRTCKASGDGMEVLLYSTHLFIRSIRLMDMTSVTAVPETSMVAGLDFDSVDNTVYWSDITDKKIYARSLTSHQTKVIVGNGIEGPEGISVDWIGRNLYYVDAYLHHIVACQLNGNICAVLVNNSLYQPRALVLDPQVRLMFWSDWKMPSKIESAYMDGTGRKVLVHENLTWPNGLAVDHVLKKLYWVDAKLYTVGCVDYDGSNRKHILDQEVSHPFSLAIFEDEIYWSDVAYASIQRANKFTGKNKTTIIRDRAIPFALTISHPVLQITDTNPCVFHGCSHLCVLSDLVKGACCHCPPGMELLADSKTCRDVSNAAYLLASHKHDIMKIYPHRIGNQHYDAIHITGSKNIAAVDYDWSSQMIIFSDYDTGQVMRTWMNDTYRSEMILDVGVEMVDGLAIEWIAKNLYIADSTAGTIQVCRLDGTSRRILLKDDIQKPRGLAVDPVKGYLFYSDFGEDVARIDRCELDGSNCIILVDDLSWPNGIVLDNDRLFWVDSGDDWLETMLINGQDRKVLIRDMLHPLGVAILGPNIYITDWERDFLLYVKKNGEQEAKLEVGLDGMMGIVGVSSSKQTGTNLCAVNNGGCSRLCLAKAMSQFICQCPMGMEISGDGVSCQGRCYGSFVIVHHSSWVPCKLSVYGMLIPKSVFCN